MVHEPTAERDFLPPHERHVDQLLEDRIEVLAIEVQIGRTELKERLVQRLQPTYNLPGSAKARRVKAQRETHPNAYLRWTDEQDARLAEAYGNGATVTELTTQFQRQRGAILSRLRKLERRGTIVA